MADVKYKIAGGMPTRKWKASAATGLGVGGAVGIFVAYVVSRLDPTMPADVLAALIWLITWALTQASMMAAGWYARPAEEDRPVVDEPARGIPPA